MPGSKQSGLDNSTPAVTYAENLQNHNIMDWSRSPEDNIVCPSHPRRFPDNRSSMKDACKPSDARPRGDCKDLTTREHCPSPVSFSQFFSRTLASTDAWTLPCELIYVLLYSYIHFPYHILHRAFLSICFLCARVSPALWVASARPKLIACDRVTMVMGNLLMILIKPTREVGAIKMQA